MVSQRLTGLIVVISCVVLSSCGVVQNSKLDNALKSQFAKSHNYNGRINYEKGDREKALADFTQAIALNPKLANAYFNRALIYRDKGDMEKALVDFTQAIALNPKDAYAYGNRGNIYYEKKDKEKAIADFKKAVNLFQQQGEIKEASELSAFIKSIEKN